MGKSSKYPAYATGNININGNNVASTSKQNNTVNSSYNMSDLEKSIYDGVQSNLAQSLGNLFAISDEKQKQWNSQLETYKKQGIKAINDIYTPMETALKNDIASRFGNLDNSIFMNNLSSITDNKAQAVADLSDNILSKQSDLYNTELANRMNYVNTLNNLYNGFNNNILNYMQFALKNSESGNNYNDRAYKAKIQQQKMFLNTLDAIANLGTQGINGYKTLTDVAASKVKSKTT